MPPASQPGSPARTAPAPRQFAPLRTAPTSQADSPHPATAVTKNHPSVPRQLFTAEPKITSLRRALAPAHDCGQVTLAWPIDQSHLAIAVTSRRGIDAGASMEPSGNRTRGSTLAAQKVDIQLQRLRWWNHAAALRDGRVDVGFVRLPLPTDGLEIRELYTEPVCVALPAEHTLAHMTSVEIAVLAGEPVLRYADAQPEWNAFWTFDPRPDASHPPPGP